MHRQVQSILSFALALNVRNLKLGAIPEQKTFQNSKVVRNLSFEQRYEELKQQEGELLRYSMILQEQPLNDHEAKTLLRLLDITRDTVYAAKAMKDIRANLVTLRHTTTEPLQSFIKDSKTGLTPFYKGLFVLLIQGHDRDYLKEHITMLLQMNEDLHNKLHQNIKNYSKLTAMETEQLSTLLNVNREIWHCGRNLIHAMENWFEL